MGETMTELLIRRDQDGVCTLILNRPEKRNALNRELFQALRRAGGHFCGGHDLSEPAHADAFGWLRKQMHTLERFSQLRAIVIAAVEGSCYTGGLEMALSADFIVCDETARFADTHAKWGLVPGWGMSQRLPRRVGSARAIEMMTTSRPYTGREAETIGLANLCVEHGKLDAALAEYAKAILANSRHSNAENKRLIFSTDGMRLADGLDHELMRNAGFDKTRSR